MIFKLFVAKFAMVFIVISGLGTNTAAVAQGIEQLLIERIPVPTRRPNDSVTSPSITVASTSTIASRSAFVSGQAAAPASAISGSLRDGLDALSKKDVSRARGIRAGMAGGTLDRKILAWAIALSGLPGITSGEIAKIAGDLPNWPGQTTMRTNSEAAFGSENISAGRIIQAFSGQKPASVTGGMVLAKAYLDTGNARAANAAIAPFWREEKLDKVIENKVLAKVGRALNRNDHRYRMHKLFYRDRTKAANRASKFAEQTSLAKARTAVSSKSTKAGKLLAAVAPSSKRDPGYLFAQIQHARRAGDYHKAAKLMLKAPKGSTNLVHPDEWWVERRIISRHMIDLGDARTAYKLAAGHAAATPAKIAEAEFHAGWYALRFLKNKNNARRHFANILKVSGRPISQARGYYWLGRATTGNTARDHFKRAAMHSGTFYGQLAAAKLGKRRLDIRKPRPSTSERAKFKNRELVRAITKLEAADHGWRANIIYRHLAKTFNSPGELALLSARAERRGDPSLALQVGKIAYGRGLPVDTLSWPTGAIPTAAKIGKTGRALAYAIARQESAFNPKAVSPANARGLLQLLPGTAKQVARKNGVSYSYKRLTSDPAYNATLGSAYLSEQLDNFDNSYILTFVGYNAGPGRVREWLQTYGDPRGKSIEQVIDWIERIPFTETRNYVQRVMENYQIYKARIDGGKFDIVADLVSGRH